MAGAIKGSVIALDASNGLEIWLQPTKHEK
jgi:hypothetical protein